MARRLSIGLNGSALEGGGWFHLGTRLVSSALAVVIALMVAIAVIGVASKDRDAPAWMPGWLIAGEGTTSRPSSDHVTPREADPPRGDHANDDGYLEGVAKAMGFGSVEQMTRASHAHASPSMVRR